MNSRRRLSLLSLSLAEDRSDNPDRGDFLSDTLSLPFGNSLGFASSIVTFKRAMLGVLARYFKAARLARSNEARGQVPLVKVDQTEPVKRSAPLADADHFRPEVVSADGAIRDAPAFLRPRHRFSGSTAELKIVWAIERSRFHCHQTTPNARALAAAFCTRPFK